MINNAGVKLVCLLVALVLWVEVASNQSMEELVELPLALVGLPDSLAVHPGELPGRVGVRIRGTKLDLMLDQLVGRGAGKVEIGMETAQPGRIRRSVSVLDVRATATALEIVPDVDLDFLIHPRVRREIPVRLAVEGQLPQGFTLAGKPEISPPSVTVVGPKPVVDAMAHVNTQPLRLDRRRSGFTERVSLANPDATVQLIPVEVDVAIGVDEVRERVFVEVPLSIMNALDPRRIHVDPTHAQVRVTGAGGAVTALRVEDVSVLLHVGEFEPGVYQLEPEVVTPDGILHTSVEPASFQVIVEPPTPVEEQGP